ncbi:MAG TPA: hypothetical protein DCS67_07110 [Clostridiales bacterium UBA8960]|nr:hypothetical protein [Clostridiales bacterium UBA8960]
MSNMSMILPYRKKGTQIQFLVKSAFIPGWDQHPDLCGIASNVSNDMFENAIMETLKQETGVNVEADSLIRLGVCAIKRSSDHICYLYSVDLTKKLDVTQDLNEAFSWIDDDKMMESIDPQLLACYAKLKFLVL